MAASPEEQLSPEAVGEILNGPGLPTPDGSPPNYDNPVTLESEMYATLGICLSLATLLLAARVYTKCFVIRKLHWEDYSIFFGWIFFLAFCAELFVVTPYGEKHMWDTRLSDVFRVLYYANIIEILYNPTIMFIKLAILFQYLRIFVPSRRNNLVMFYATIGTMITMIIFYVILTLLIVFVCSPRDASWNKLLPGKCYDINAILVSTAVVNLASDLVILALPQYSIWQLRMAGKRKAGVSAIFGLGGVACVVTALRIQSTVELIRTQDATWYLGPTAMWAVAEVTLGIICCCLPVMPKFIQTITRNLSKLSRSSRSNGTREGSITFVASQADHDTKTSNIFPEDKRVQLNKSPELRGPWQSTSAGTWHCETDPDDVEASAETVQPPQPHNPVTTTPHEGPPDRIMRTVLIEWRESRN